MVDVPKLGMFFLITLDFLGSKSELGLAERNRVTVKCSVRNGGRTSAV
jgi:hypothetical protein